MAVLARKIALAKWGPPDGFAAGEIGADAVTADLKTTGNTLSFWTCSDSSAGELANVFLALAAASERVDRLDLAWLSDHAVSLAGLSTKPSAGNTPVASLRRLHVDVERLDFVRLGKVARLVANAVLNGQGKRLAKHEVLALLVHAVRDGTLKVADLKPKVREEVCARLGAAITELQPSATQANLALGSSQQDQQTQKRGLDRYLERVFRLIWPRRPK